MGVKMGSGVGEPKANPPWPHQDPHLDPHNPHKMEKIRSHSCFEKIRTMLTQILLYREPIFARTLWLCNGGPKTRFFSTHLHHYLLYYEHYESYNNVHTYFASNIKSIPGNLDSICTCLMPDPSKNELKPSLLYDTSSIYMGFWGNISISPDSSVSSTLEFKPVGPWGP